MSTGDNATETNEGSIKRFWGHSILWWEWAGGLFGSFIIGFRWFVFNDGLSDVFIVIHGFAQWSPLLLLLPWLSGWASCERGLPWLQHIIYLITAIGASPFTGKPRGCVVENMGIPLFGLRGTLMAAFYHYVITLLHMFDTYGDAMNVAIAWSCGWTYAWLMLVVLLVSQVIQALAGFCADAAEGHLLVFFGFLPDAVATADAGGVKFAVYLGITRMLSENLPQAVLSLWFAHDMKTSKLVYVNVAISLAMASKTFFSSLSRLLKSDYTSVTPNA